MAFSLQVVTQTWLWNCFVVSRFFRLDWNPGDRHRGKTGPQGLRHWRLGSFCRFIQQRVLAFHLWRVRTTQVYQPCCPSRMFEFFGCQIYPCLKDMNDESWRNLTRELGSTLPADFAFEAGCFYVFQSLNGNSWKVWACQKAWNQRWYLWFPIVVQMRQMKEHKKGGNPVAQFTRWFFGQGRCSFWISHDYNSWGGWRSVPNAKESLLAGLRKELLRCVQEPSKLVKWVVLDMSQNSEGPQAPKKLHADFSTHHMHWFSLGLLQVRKLWAGCDEFWCETLGFLMFSGFI